MLCFSLVCGVASFETFACILVLILGTDEEWKGEIVSKRFFVFLSVLQY